MNRQQSVLFVLKSRLDSKASVFDSFVNGFSHPYGWVLVRVNLQTTHPLPHPDTYLITNPHASSPSVVLLYTSG
jgi:hypothetical protein